MKTLFYLITLVMMSGLQAQAPLIINIPNRDAQQLDGKWRYLIDPMENGYYTYRYKESSNGFFKNQKPQDESDLVEYDFDKADQLNVPGDWNTQSEALFFYEGTIWYKKSFLYDTAPGRKFLYFGAVNYDAKVYLNGKKLGAHQGGFTPFNFEVTDLLQDGENVVIVKVDNTRKSEYIPTKNSDWFNFGGITRSVQLVTVPEVFVRDYFIQLKKGSRTEVEGWVQLDGQTCADQQVTVSVPEAKVSVSAKTDAQGRAVIHMKAKWTLWSDKNPKLYEVKIQTAEDVLSDKIGFRTIEVSGQNILLNGESVFLKGISIHEVAPFTAGRVVAPEQCRTLLTWAKELGCNFVRLAHYPHNEAMVRMAEEMGLLVWSEIPVYWTIEWENEAVFHAASQQLEEMIIRDKNRAAVVMWSVANETPISEPRTAFLRRLVEKARTLDNTRLLTGALEPHSDETHHILDDPFGQYLDVIGVNNYCGWYGGTPESCSGLQWKMLYDKPLIMSEYGGGALQGLHGSETERWTEEYQAAVYRNNIEMLKKMPFLRGATPWILMDFYSARRPLTDIQDYFNRKGLISDQGIRKQAFFILQNYYTEFPQQLLK